MQATEFKLDEGRRRLMLGEIRTFFEDDLGDEIGDLKARLVLDFFLKRLGAEIYNEAIGDVQTWFQNKLLDIEGELHRT
jgi:uncharacterized protein (DUF2164 family)